MAGWNGRFDDPDRRFRTLYAAGKPETAIREVFAPLRPSAEMRAGWRTVFGEHSDAEEQAGRVALSEHGDRVLSCASVRLAVPLADLTQPETRTAIGSTHAELLAAHGLPYLDETDVRVRDRTFTQALTRALFVGGHGGIAYRSNVDNGRCFALFEGRYTVDDQGEPMRLGANPDDLRRVLASIGLRLVD